MKQKTLNIDVTTAIITEFLKNIFSQSQCSSSRNFWYSDCMLPFTKESMGPYRIWCTSLHCRYWLAWVWCRLSAVKEINKENVSSFLIYWSGQLTIWTYQFKAGGGGVGGSRAWGGDLTFSKNLPSNSLPTGKLFQSNAQKFPQPGRHISRTLIVCTGQKIDFVSLYPC